MDLIGAGVIGTKRAEIAAGRPGCHLVGIRDPIDEKPRTRGQDALRILAVFSTIFDSGATGKTVKLGQSNAFSHK